MTNLKIFVIVLAEKGGEKMRKIFYLAILVIFGAISFYGCFDNPITGPLPTPDYSKDPVVFVHGFSGGGWNFDILKEYLKADGWPQEYLLAISYSDNLGCNEKNAEELKAFIDNVLSQTGKSKVDIVAHSMGGISTRYYIKNLGGAEKVNDVVTLGTPNHGTLCAGVAIITCGAQQMIPNSDFLKELNSGDETPGANVKWTQIWSNTDECNCPPTNSILDGAWNVMVTAVGHASLLIDKIQTYPKILDGLNGNGKNSN